MEQREAYIEKYKAQLEQWEAEAEKLKAKAAAASADMRIQYGELVRDLQQRISRQREKLNKMSLAGGDAWQELKAGFEKAWNELEAAWGSAVSKLR